MIINKWIATPEGSSYYKGPESRYSPGMCPKTLDLLSCSIHIDISPALSEQDCDLIAQAVNKVARVYL